MKKDNITHKINENGDIIFELQDVMEILFDLGKQQFAIHLFNAFDETGILTDGVFNYTKFKEVDKNRIQRTRGVGNRAMRVYYDLEDILADYESTQILTIDELEAKRRQEVVELAEKLITNELFAVTNHMHDMRELGAAINLDSPTEYAFLIAEEFVNNKSIYLENGKLC